MVRFSTLRFPFSGFVAAGPIATSRWRLQQEIYSLTKRKKVIGLSPPVRPWSRLSICHPRTSEQDQSSLPLLKSPYPATRTKTFLFNPQYRKINQAFTTPLSASHQPAQPKQRASAGLACRPVTSTCGVHLTGVKQRHKILASLVKDKDFIHSLHSMR